MKTYYGTKRIKAEPSGIGYNVEYEDGYTSWSPAEAFEKAYRASGELNFGHALAALREGHRVARSGWNGKGLFVYLVPENSYPASTEAAKKQFAGGLVPYNAYFAIKNADNTVGTWVPSVGDCLANDWVILEN